MTSSLHETTRRLFFDSADSGDEGQVATRPLAINQPAPSWASTAATRIAGPTRRVFRPFGVLYSGDFLSTSETEAVDFRLSGELLGEVFAQLKLWLSDFAELTVEAALPRPLGPISPPHRSLARMASSYVGDDVGVLIPREPEEAAS